MATIEELTSPAYGQQLNELTDGMLAPGQRFLTPWQAQGQPLDRRTLQAALMRLTPEERKAMFEPYGEEFSGLDEQMKQQPHSTALGAALGAAGNALAAIQKGQAMKRKQGNSQATYGAVYGPDNASPDDANRQAMVAALLGKNKDPFGLAPLTLGGGG